MKDDEFYPCKEDDVIEIIEPKDDKGYYVEIKSSPTDKSIKLMFSLDEKYNKSCYTSEVKADKNYRSINYAISVKDNEQKFNLLIYVVRWVVDQDDNFLQWEQPQLLADCKIFGGKLINIYPFIPTKDRVEGIEIIT